MAVKLTRMATKSVRGTGVQAFNRIGGKWLQKSGQKLAKSSPWLSTKHVKTQIRPADELVNSLSIWEGVFLLPATSRFVVVRFDFVAIFWADSRVREVAILTAWRIDSVAN